ncbi:MAG TPA: hypothetical protein VHD87_15295 [Acidimicrobiales bacterium]|nr:hypothetical protein [Acidimicrobiales bacterium]
MAGGPLSERLGERFAQVGRVLDAGALGDPHVAFAVLVYPEREPEIVVVADRCVAALSSLRAGGDGGDESAGRWFTFEDLAMLVNATRDADFALRHAAVLTGGRDDVGAYAQERIREGWERRIMQTITEALRRADEAAARPAACGSCQRRFTERGLQQHLRQSRCGQAQRDEEPSARS